jgi:hypothetical protein
MIILGHPLIASESLYKVTKIEDIKKTEPNSTVLIDFIDKELVQYTKKQNIPLALHVKSIKEACLANALGAKYIVVEDTISQDIQKIATEYLFDSKILLHVEDENGIEVAAKNYIDGVVLQNAIK